MAENHFHIIIVGAGAAGLAAAVELTKAGKKVAILEARSRVGGRINTIQPPGFDLPIEAGAEFVHGDLPVTLRMLKEYKIPLQATAGEMWRARDGQLTADSWEVPGFDKLFKAFAKIKTDTSVQKFLEENFSDAKYYEMNSSIRRFVEGFDTGDISTASVLKFRDEWSSLEDENQYRVEGGYSRLMDALSDDFKNNGGVIILSTPVNNIKWEGDYVQVSGKGNKVYTASKILITVPLGILQADATTEGHINFSPPVTEKISAAKKMGYGAIIKAVFRFSDAFWNRFGFQKNNIGFIFSGTPVPTFWTQMPDPKPYLTAWLGGPMAREWQFMDDEKLLNIMLSSLAITFGIGENELKGEISAWHISNWSAEPYTLGAYCFATVGDNETIKILREPVQDTIFFAGEALYEGDATGTVEAALSNGLEMAGIILGSRQSA